MRSLILATTLLFSALSFAQGGPYSTSETPIGTLLEDPAAVAVLEEHIPGFTSNPDIAMASGLTLVQVQVYFPEPISDEEMAAIDADLSAISAD
jgi:hypothetical protein